MVQNEETASPYTVVVVVVAVAAVAVVVVLSFLCW